MQETIQYLIHYILGEHISSQTVSLVGYTNNENEFANYRIIIKPSSFFDDEIYGTDKSLPALPLKIWEEIPVIFGEPGIEKNGNTLILNADLIASTYFLITRYEEMVRNTVRDVHGRFPGKESLPYRAGFIDRPLVEEYGKVLRSVMRDAGFDAPEPEKKISKVYLTHDLDQIAHFRTVRGMIGGVLRGLKRKKEGQKALQSFFGGLRNDPWYTFPYLYKLDNELVTTIGSVRCEPIIFIRSGGRKRKEDKPFSDLAHPDYKNLIRYSKRKNINIGLHASYDASITPSLITDEKKRLDNFAKVSATYNRHHYLNTREPADMRALIDAGISDDFTLGYADMAGFRLGTCRAVRWIDPHTRQLTSLTLHPLTIMDSTLSDKRYMYMNAHDAFYYCEQLINCVKSFNGELVLLWHNTSVEKTPQSYHRKLYKDLIKLLQTL